MPLLELANATTNKQMMHRDLVKSKTRHITVTQWNMPGTASQCCTDQRHRRPIRHLLYDPSALGVDTLYRVFWTHCTTNSIKTRTSHCCQWSYTQFHWCISAKSRWQGRSQLLKSFPTTYTLCLKKTDTDVACYNFNAHHPILIFFGRDICY